MSPRLTELIAGLLLSVLVFSASVRAQDEPGAAAPPTPAGDEKKADEGAAPADDTPKDDAAGDTDTKPEDQQTPEEEWKTLSARRWEIARKLNELKTEFADADSARKKEIRSEFDGLIFEFNVHVRSRLQKLASTIFAADPKNKEAGELVLRAAWESTDLEKARTVAETLLQEGVEDEFVLNTAGFVYCEQQDYEKAKEILSKADAASKLDPVNGKRYLKLAQAYLDYAKDNKNAEAADQIVEDAYLHHRYAKVIEVARQQVEAGNNSEAVLSYQGASQFATNDFKGAEETLALAKADNKLNFSAQQIETRIAKYLEFWQNELALREAEKAAGDDKAKGLPRVQLKTTKGDIELVLTENEAPNTVANFISLIEGKKYDGTAFHRVVPNFVIQGGDPNSLNDDPLDDGQGGPGYTIACECYAENARKHFRGSLSMAHAGKDTGGSQFFITHRPTANLNGDKDREQGHTVFGYVTKGMDVVDSITKGDRILEATVLFKRDHEYAPKTVPDEK